MKTEQQIREYLKNTEDDERLRYRPATTFENAPLALVQTYLETVSKMLRWVLDEPARPPSRTDGGR